MLSDTMKRVLRTFGRTGLSTVAAMKQATPHYYPALKSLISKGLVQGTAPTGYSLTVEGGKAMPDVMDDPVVPY